MSSAPAFPSVRLPHKATRAALWIGSIVATLAANSGANATQVESLHVMTFNILGGADQPVARFVDVIEAAEADVIGFQEAGTVMDDISLALGFHYHQFNADLGIASRYPITEVLIGGVKLELSPGQEVYVYDAHLPAFPYQPYSIRDGLIGTEAEAIAAAHLTRGAQIANRISHLAPALASGLPTFFVGDFNEPSHLDWTQVAADAGLNFNLKVDWPTSNAVVNAGLVDAFRELRPDEVNDRAETWTPGYEGMPANEVHDRIDLIYYTPGDMVPVAAYNVGHDINDGNTDIGLAPTPYPSDHRAVVIEFDMTILPGDYNDDGTVDAADYTVWRDHLGGDALTAFAAGSRDLSNSGPISADDYTAWKNNFGNSGAAAIDFGPTAVPEPSTLLMLVLATVGLPLLTFRTHR